jgi:hypothetical protein
MRWLLSFGLTVLCAATVCAQSNTPAGPPAVSVVDNKWLKVRKRDMSTLTIPPPVVDEQSGMVKPPNDNSDFSLTRAP